MSGLWALMIALSLWFPGHVADAITVLNCETTGLDITAVNPLSGAKGLFQVKSEFWGEVPDDIFGQVEQAARITHGGEDWRYWECKP